MRHTITWIDLKGVLLSKNANIKRSPAVGFHLYNIFEMAKIIDESRLVVVRG